MAFNPVELKSIKDAFNEMVRNSPDPDAPAFGFVGGKIHSLNELSAEIENGTQTGQSVLAMIEHAVRKEGLEKVIEQLKNQPKP